MHKIDDFLLSIAAKISLKTAATAAHGKLQGHEFPCLIRRLKKAFPTLPPVWEMDVLWWPLSSPRGSFCKPGMQEQPIKTESPPSTSRYMYYIEIRNLKSVFSLQAATATRTAPNWKSWEKETQHGTGRCQLAAGGCWGSGSSSLLWPGLGAPHGHTASPTFSHSPTYTLQHSASPFRRGRGSALQTGSDPCSCSQCETSFPVQTANAPLSS